MAIGQPADATAPHTKIGRTRSGALRSFTFSIYVSLAVLTSFFPGYFDSLGFTKLQIGVLFSVGPGIGIAANLIWAIVSDKWQTLKKTIVAVLIGQFVLMALLLQTDDFPVALALMAVFYFFQTPMSGLNDSQLLLATKASGKNYASYRLMGSLGFALSAFVVGLLLKLFGIGLLPIVIMISIGCSLALAFLLAERQGSLKKVSFSGLGNVLLARKTLVFLLLVFGIATASRANDGFLSLHLTQLGADPSIIGYTWTVSAICEIPVFLLLAKYGNRYHELPLLAAATLMYTLRFGLMGFVNDPIWIVAIQMLNSLSFGIFFFTALRYMQQLVPDQFRATGQAVFAVVWSGLPGLIGGIVGGRVFDEWGGHALYRCSATIAAGVCLVFVWKAAANYARKREV